MLTVRNANKFDWENIPITDCMYGNAMDAHYTLKVFNVLSEKLLDLELYDMYDKVLSPANTVFLDPEYKGLFVSPDRLKDVGRTLNNAIIDVHDGLYEFDQLELSDNLSSTKDLRSILYTREGGFELYPPDKTDKGAPSTNADTLKILLSQIKQELANRE